MRYPCLGLVGVVVLVAVGACGGSGGSDTPTPTAPGTTRRVALEGEAAPGGGGDFLAFPTATPLSLAQGGWSAFVGNTTVLGQMACVYTPGRALHRVYAVGDAAPDLGSGQLSSIDAVWINEDGVLVALVGVTGGPVGVTAGLVTAEVDEAGVVGGSKFGAIYTGRDMSDTGVAGDLQDLFAGNVHLRASDTFYFGGETDVGESALWRVDRDGTGLVRVVGTGDALPGGPSVVDVLASEVDASGVAFAFIAEITGVGGPRGLYTGQIGTVGYDEIAIEGDALVGPDIIGELPAPQAMVVYSGQGGASVVYRAVSDLGQDYLILGLPDPTDDYLIVKEGEADTKVTGGTFGSLDWLHNEPGAARPMFQARMSGAQGITFAVFSLEGVNFNTGVVAYAIATYNGRPAPGGVGQAFSTTFPGLGAAGYVDASAGASLAFSNVLSPSGSVGLYWLVRGQGLFLTALTGRDIPGGGDRYGADTTWRQTTASGAILFRAPVEGAGSGIFRRGP